MKRIISILAIVSQVAWGALTFDSTVAEVAAGPGALEAGADFPFTNTGKEPADIAYIDPDCDCLSIMVKGGTKLKDGKIRFEPGEKGVIRSTFKIGNSKGLVEQVAAIWMDGDPKDKPSIQLTTRISVPELVALDAKTLKWPVGSQAAPKRIRVTMNHSEPILVTGLTSTSKQFHAELETIEAGKLYDVVVTPVDTSAPGIAVIQITTDCKVDKQSRPQAYAILHRPE